jgi:peptidoglycan/xylan/chitin deacetylase (PgdA/CDA1 family)
MTAARIASAAARIESTTVARPPGARRRLAKRVVAGGLSLAAWLGAWPVLRTLARDSLSILLYHRIGDPAAPRFFGLASNVSATPAAFARQLDHLARHYNVIDLATCLAWLREERQLPPRAVMITFDDGYRDILSVALPELAARRLPATLFLATDYVADARPLFWDLVAEAMRRTTLVAAELPLIGARDWSAGRPARDAVADAFVQRALALSPEARTAAVAALGVQLAVDLPERPPPRTFVDWQDVRELERGGVTVCPHTMSHPALVTLSDAAAEHEIAGSAAQIAERLAAPRPAFAYPYGRSTDFGARDEALLARLGFAAAFRSNGGLNLAREARARPFALRRAAVFLHHDMTRFTALAAGASRLERRMVW